MIKKFVLNLLFYCWLSFDSYESSLDRVFTWIWLIVCFCFSCLLVFSFALYFWWMGSHPWFVFTFLPQLKNRRAWWRAYKYLSCNPIFHPKLEWEIPLGKVPSKYTAQIPQGCYIGVRSLPFIRSLQKNPHHGTVLGIHKFSSLYNA